MSDQTFEHDTSGTHETRDNLTDQATWLRLLYMVLFAIAFNIAEILIAAIAVFQFFKVLFTKEPNEKLKSLGRDLAVYIGDVAKFLTFQTDKMPYPVSDWGEPPKKKKLKTK